MKVLFYCVVMLLFSACLSTKKQHNFSINASNIKHAEIKQSSSLGIVLNNKQIEKLCENLNNNKVLNPTKYMKIYTIDFTLKNDSVVSLYANTDIFSAQTMHTYEVKTKNFFDEFWTNIGGEKAFYLFKTVSNIEGNLIESSSQNLDKETLNNLQKVLAYYKINTTIVNDKLYYSGNMSLEESYDYMLKAQDSIWLEKHN